MSCEIRYKQQGSFLAKFRALAYLLIIIAYLLIIDFKGILLGLRQFLATESPLKMMKNGFYFTLKALFVLKIFHCFS